MATRITQVFPVKLRHCLLDNDKTKFANHEPGKSNELGHWRPNSAMPLRYDSSYTTAQLLSKADILTQYNRGWRLVGPGMVPNERLPGEPDNDEPKIKKPRYCERLLERSLLASLRIVVNEKKKTAHLYYDGTTSLCEFFSCGSPDVPNDNAAFLPVADLQNPVQSSLCRGCFKALGTKLSVPKDDNPVPEKDAVIVAPDTVPDVDSEGSEPEDVDSTPVVDTKNSKDD